MKAPDKGYEAGFLEQLDQESAQIVAEKGIKLIHNGGALNPRGLADATKAMLKSYRVSLKIACVEGDNVMSILDDLKTPGKTSHLDVKGRDLSFIKSRIRMPMPTLEWVESWPP